VRAEEQKVQVGIGRLADGYLLSGAVVQIPFFFGSSFLLARFTHSLLLVFFLLQKIGIRCR